VESRAEIRRAQQALTLRLAALLVAGSSLLPWFATRNEGIKPTAAAKQLFPGLAAVDSNTYHSANAWSASWLWSAGLLLVTAALLIAAWIRTRGSAAKVGALALTAALSAALGAGAIGLQWWRLRPHPVGTGHATLTFTIVPPNKLPELFADDVGQIRRGHLEWTSDKYYRAEPTVVADAVSIFAGLAAVSLIAAGGSILTRTRRPAPTDITAVA
jgi:hypothetical protein